MVQAIFRLVADVRSKRQTLSYISVMAGCTNPFQLNVVAFLKGLPNHHLVRI
jgi:hypothetical protein